MEWNTHRALGQLLAGRELRSEPVHFRRDPERLRKVPSRQARPRARP